VGATFVSDIVARRRAERDRLIDRAREHVDRLAARRNVIAAIVVGSVARGDFNVWSDVDVVVLVDMLPDRAPDRLAMVNDGASAGIQVIGYTPTEFAHAVRQRNRMALEAIERGVLIHGKVPVES
jgi:predicted nucleotidyltransferase